MFQHIQDRFFCLFDDFGFVGRGHLFKIFAYQGGTHIRSHDDNGVFEINQSAFVIGQSSVIEYLQQNVEDVGVSLFYFVEQNHRIRFTPDCFGQLATFVVSNVSRRGTDETSGTEFLLIFTHVDTSHHVLIVKQIFGKSFR